MLEELPQGPEAPARARIARKARSPRRAAANSRRRRLFWIHVKRAAGGREIVQDEGGMGGNRGGNSDAGRNVHAPRTARLRHRRQQRRSRAGCHPGPSQGSPTASAPRQLRAETDRGAGEGDRAAEGREARTGDRARASARPHRERAAAIDAAAAAAPCERARSFAEAAPDLAPSARAPRGSKGCRDELQQLRKRPATWAARFDAPVEAGRHGPKPGHAEGRRCADCAGRKISSRRSAFPCRLHPSQTLSHPSPRLRRSLHRHSSPFRMPSSRAGAAGACEVLSESW